MSSGGATSSRRHSPAIERHPASPATVAFGPDSPHNRRIRRDRSRFGCGILAPRQSGRGDGPRRVSAAQVSERYPPIHTIRCNAGNTDDILRLAAEVAAEFPQLDVLINNAGISRYLNIAAPTADLAALTEELNVNASGGVRTTSAFIGMLIANKGTIINVSSAPAYVPLPCLPVYCASKAAIHSYSQSLRFQLEGTGVEVVEVMPPAVRTDMTRDLVEGDGLTLISVKDLMRITFDGFAAGKAEIHPGRSKQLALMRRLAPDFINRQLWKAARKYVPAAVEAESQYI